MGRDGTRAPPRQTTPQPRSTSQPLFAWRYFVGLAHGPSQPMLATPLRRAALRLAAPTHSVIPLIQLRQACLVLISSAGVLGGLDSTPGHRDMLCYLGDLRG